MSKHLKHQVCQPNCPAYTPEPIESLDECGASVYWWDGEYDGNCELPKGHKTPFHYDGVSYYDDDMNNRNDEQEALEAYITERERLARIGELNRLHRFIFTDSGVVSEADINSYITAGLAQLQSKEQQ